MRIIEVNPEAIDLIEAKILDDFSEVETHMVEANALKTHTKANIRVTITKVIITKAIVVYITTHVETIMTTINTISIMVMMMSTSLISMVHHVHYVMAIITPPPKHCFKGEHDINDIMKKMNISGHQSQQSGLYS